MDEIYEGIRRGNDGGRTGGAFLAGLSCMNDKAAADFPKQAQRVATYAGFGGAAGSVLGGGASALNVCRKAAIKFIKRQPDTTNDDLVKQINNSSIRSNLQQFSNSNGKGWFSDLLER